MDPFLGLCVGLGEILSPGLYVLPARGFSSSISSSDGAELMHHGDSPSRRCAEILGSET